MTQLDLDTTTLAAAGADVGGAASALSGPPGLALGALSAAPSMQATGDAGLSAALDDLASAWRATQESLVGELGSVGSGLTRAAEVFDGAEQVTVQALAGLLGPSAPTGPPGPTVPTVLTAGGGE